MISLLTLYANGKLGTRHCVVSLSGIENKGVLCGNETPTAPEGPGEYNSEECQTTECEGEGNNASSSCRGECVFDRYSGC